MRGRYYFFVFVVLIVIAITSGLNFSNKEKLSTNKPSIDQHNSSNGSFRNYHNLPKASDIKNYEIIL